MFTNTTKRISTESPQEYIWDKYLFLENEEAVKRILEYKYKNLGKEDYRAQAYKNAHQIIHLTRHARSVFQSVENNLWTEPLHLYYAIMSLCKILILTESTDYPQNTAVLRHGVSTRKRKKLQYSFFDDDVRIQREGLLPLLLEHLKVKKLINYTYSPKDLFGFFPELSESYQQLFNSFPMAPIGIPTTQPFKETMTLFIDDSVLDIFQVTPRGFIDKLNSKTESPMFSLGPKRSEETLTLNWRYNEYRNIDDWNKGFNHPSFFEDLKGNHYMYLPGNQNGPIPELACYLMIFFCLSMLSRYETSLWGEMINNTSDEMVLIKPLFRLARRKLPHLVLNHIFEERLIIHLE